MSLQQSLNKKTAPFPELCLFGALLVTLIGGGGIFWQDVVLPMVLLCIGAIAARKNGNGIAWRGAVLAFMLFAAVSVFTAITDRQVGIHDIYKLLCFIAAVCIGVTITDRQALYRVLLLTSAILALVGVLAVCGVIEIADYVLAENARLPRLQSFFGYANTAACFLGCGYLAFLHGYASKPGKALYLLGNLILLSVFLTQSKAAIPMLFFATFVLAQKEKTTDILFAHAISGAITFAALFLLHGKVPPFALVAAALIGIAIGLPIEMISRIPKRVKKIVFFAVLAAAAVAASLLLIRSYSGSTLQQRFIYMKDGLQLFLAHPLFGSGGGGWQYLQYTVQTISYRTLYMHNGWLEILSEYGVFTAISFIGLFIWALVRSIRSRETEVAAMLGLIGAHSFLDIDLSYASVLILLGALVGSCFAQPISQKQPEKKKPGWIRTADCLILAALIASTAFMTTEYFLDHAMANAVQNDELTEAEHYADTMEALFPYDSHVQHVHAAIAQRQQDREKMLFHLERALMLSPYDMQICKDYIALTATKENLKPRLLYAMKLQPLQSGTYDMLEQLLREMKTQGVITLRENKILYYYLLHFRKNAVELQTVGKNDSANQMPDIFSIIQKEE